MTTASRDATGYCTPSGVPSQIQVSDASTIVNTGLPAISAISSWKKAFSSTNALSSSMLSRIRTTDWCNSSACSSVTRAAARRASSGSSTTRASSTVRNDACSSWSIIAMMLARCRDPGRLTIGPPPGPVLIVITPWISRNRSASRSVPRATPYSSSIVFSGGSGEPCASPPSVISPTIRCASRAAVFWGRSPSRPRGRVRLREVPAIAPKSRISSGR